MATEIMSRMDEANETDKETLRMVGGMALVLLGAGLMLSTPTVRRYLGQLGLANIAYAALPELERFFRIRAM
jgi:hypothetical protein